jgi:cell division protein YceG involved in septum cleavage
MDAIDAVLNPEETGCFYYLHDPSRAIYCAKTLEEHEANIEMYLK